MAGRLAERLRALLIQNLDRGDGQIVQPVFPGAYAG